MNVSTSSARRFARRVWARRWSRVKVILVGLAVAAVGVLAGWVVLYSSLLAVRQVEIVGTSRVSTAQVEAVAAVPTGTPLARIDLSSVAGRVRSLPAVRDATVSRRWPRAVEIEVWERVPAAVQARGPSYDLVDRSGVAFDTVPSRPPGLPLVSAPADAGPPALRAALDVLAATPPALRPQVLEVRAGGPEQVTLLLTKGRTVVWGSPDRGARKATVLAALLTRRATVYDVSAPDAPTTSR